MLLVVLRTKARRLWADLRAIDAAWRKTTREGSPLVAVVVAFLPAFAAAFWLATLAPTTATDPIAYHFPAARHYLASGGLTPLPILPGAFSEDSRRLFSLGHSAAYSFYPQSFELLLAAFWSLDGQAAARMLSPLFAFAGALLAFALGRRCGLSRAACVVGVAAAAAIPVVSWSGAIAKNDSMLTCFELAALLSLVTARGRQPRRCLLLAAFFLGLSFGVKHVALFGAIPLALLALARLRRQRAPIRLAAAMAAVGLLAGFSWHLRTWAATGNPLFPAGARYAAIALPAVGGMSATPWLDRIAYPWIAHFRGRMTNEGPSDNPLGFYLAFFAVGWLLLRRKQACAAERDCLFFCGVFALYWIYSWGVVRYGAPLLYVLAVLTAGRLEGLAALGRWPRRLAAAALAYCFAFALLPALMLEVNPIQLRYFARRLDKTEYLREMLSGYRAIEFLNARIGPAEKALAIDNPVLAYAHDPLRFRCVELRGRMTESKVQLVARVIERYKPAYLALPHSDRGESLRTTAAALGMRSTVYSDEAFFVLEREDAPKR